MAKPKPNAEPKMYTNWILFFSVSVTEFQQIRQIILIKSVVYNLEIMKSLMDCPVSQLCDIFTSTTLQTTDFCGARTRATIKTTNLRQ